MRSNLPFILDRLPLNLAESGTDITLQWDTIVGGTFDAVLQTTTGGAPTQQTETVRGFLHFVNLAQTSSMQWNEFEHGDCIVDLSPGVTLEGRANLRFVIDGQRWVVKELGDKAPKTWDVVAQGQRLFRSVLLRKAT